MGRIKDGVSWEDYDNYIISRTGKRAKDIVGEIQGEIQHTTDLGWPNDLPKIVFNDSQLLCSDKMIHKHYEGALLETVYVPVRSMEDKTNEYHERLPERAKEMDDREEHHRSKHLDSFKTIVLGEYRKLKKQMVLYPKAIEQYSKDNNLNPLSVEESVLANLCFRAYIFHHAELLGHEKNDRGINRKVVTVLSAYFEYEYSLHRFPDVASRMKDFWRDHCCEAYRDSLACPMLDFDELTKDSFGAFRKAYYNFIMGDEKEAYSVVEACKILRGCY